MSNANFKSGFDILKTGISKKTNRPEWIEPSIKKVNKKHDVSMAKAVAKEKEQPIKKEVKKKVSASGKLTDEQIKMIKTLKQTHKNIMLVGDIDAGVLRKIVRIGDDMPYKGMLTLIDALLVNL